MKNHKKTSNLLYLSPYYAIINEENRAGKCRVRGGWADSRAKGGVTVTEQTEERAAPLGDPAVGKTEKVYIVLSQTGTILSRVLKLVTRAPYNHASLALTDDLRTLYSFGRLNPYNPFVGGFVRESPDSGTFKRFYNTEIMVLEVAVDPAARAECRALIEEMVADPSRYHYNYGGLLLAAVHIPYEREGCYYCSEFVRAMAQKMKLEGVERIPRIVQPVHMQELSHKVVYVGRLRDYAPPAPTPASVPDGATPVLLAK